MTTIEERYPHGECECRNGCQCAGVPGPAAFEVQRDGKPMKVCTRCDLSSDRPHQKLLLTEQSPVQPFADYDALGFMCIAMKLAEDRAEGPSESASKP